MTAPDPICPECGVKNPQVLPSLADCSMCRRRRYDHLNPWFENVIHVTKSPENKTDSQE